MKGKCADKISEYTVCFFSFVKFYNNVTRKVVEIINFCKKFLDGMVDAFADT